MVAGGHLAGRDRKGAVEWNSEENIIYFEKGVQSSSKIIFLKNKQTKIAWRFERLSLQEDISLAVAEGRHSGMKEWCASWKQQLIYLKAIFIQLLLLLWDIAINMVLGMQTGWGTITALKINRLPSTSLRCKQNSKDRLISSLWRGRVANIETDGFEHTHTHTRTQTHIPSPKIIYVTFFCRLEFDIHPFSGH